MSRRVFIAAVLAGIGPVSVWAAGPGPDIDAGLNPGTERPLWELGVGLAGLWVPDYRGADQGRGYLFPLPYFVYRGTWLKADRDGARALLLQSQRAKIDISATATTPTDSSKNDARQGMPDLRATAELGPNLSLTLLSSAERRYRLDLRLPLRAAFTLERSPEFVGTTFSPNLNLDLAGVGGAWNVGMLTGPLFADQKYHQHFYGVATAYATPDRPTYSARGGYAGWQALASTSRRFGNAWVGGFVRYESLRGASFEDSPLMRRNSALSMGFGVSWILATSSELVPSSD